MPDTWGFPLFIAAVLIFLGWFAWGTQWNVRKGDAVLKWLRQGLPLVGERSTLRWLGSSVMELKIAKANDPFRTAETLVVFEPRDVVFTWVWSRLRGRRDTLIFRSQLRATPSFEMEVFDPKGWTTHTSESALESKKWTRADLPADRSLVAYYSGAGGAAASKDLVDLAGRAGGKLVRLSVHRNLPNVEVHWLLPDPGARTAREFFLRLREMCESIGKV